MPNLINQIIDYEDGKLTDNETITLFAALIKDGSVWHYQGHYERTAAYLIEQGFISRNGTILTREV